MKKTPEQYKKNKSEETERNERWLDKREKQSSQSSPSQQAPNTRRELKQGPGQEEDKRPLSLNKRKDEPEIVAAEGDDDLMSQKQEPKKRQPQPQQQPQGMANADALKGKWKQHVGAAKIAWGKLTEDELLRSEGHAQKLAGLVQERYAVTRDEAEKQVDDFIASNN